MFLFVDGVLRLLDINDKGWFSDEIFIFFANIQNLHQKYCPTTKALHVQVPHVTFCNRYDDSAKINPMIKTQPYSMINTLLKKELVGPEKQKIESEIEFDVVVTFYVTLAVTLTMVADCSLCPYMCRWLLLLLRPLQSLDWLFLLIIDEYYLN